MKKTSKPGQKQRRPRVPSSVSLAAYKKEAPKVRRIGRVGSPELGLFIEEEDEDDEEDASLEPLALSADDDLETVRERIRRRAEALDLTASDATPDDYDDGEMPKNILEEIAYESLSYAEIERLADQYGDGLNIFQGAWQEFQLIEWPTPEDVIKTFFEVCALLIFMVSYVLLCDYVIQHALDPLFHYPAFHPDD